MRQSYSAFKGCFAAAAMGILILDSKTAAAGAEKGLMLCIETVIPALFPFFVLSTLLVGVLNRTIPILKPLCKAFRIPSGSEGLLIVGFLGGYPVGAQCVSYGHKQNQLSKWNAERMLVICNNCGPSFLFGMAAAVFDQWYIPWCLWAIEILSAWITARFIPCDGETVSIRHSDGCSLTDALQRSIRVMASVCGWIILFRLLMTSLDVWVLWMLPTEVQCAISGILELSNGCFDLVRIDNCGLRFLLCAAIVNFGGICVLLQTCSVVSKNINKALYFPGKVFQGFISILISIFVELIIFSRSERWIPSLTDVLTLLLTTFLSGVYLRIIEKKCSNSIPLGV